ncbi:MAG: HAD-IIIC family phosphatase [Terracidiphilus sp.]
MPLAVAMAIESGSQQEIIRRLESPRSLGSRWLRAALTERVNGGEAAKPLWEEVVDQNGCEIPDVLLHRARMLARSGDVDGAAAMIRIALQNSREYDLYIRAETVARKCRAGFGSKRRVKVALLSSSSTSLMRGVLELQFLRDGLEAEVYEPPFGTYIQELLQAGSGLKVFCPDFIVLLLNWRDLGLSGIAANDAESERAIARVTEMWQAATELPSGKIIQTTFVPPQCDANYALSSLMAHGKCRSIRSINEALYKARGDRVTLIDCERIAAAWNGKWEEPLLWSSAKVYPAPAALPTLGEHIASCIRAEMGLARKLLILDLDNTLWGGVVGEDGLNGIQLGPPSAIGERYQEFQQYLKDLRERGVLLALASKNNREDAAEVLLRHPSAVLRADDFVSMKVNWEDKVTNIRKIASELRLGLDSIVFLDDNPAERSAVRRALPEVIVPEISGEPAGSIAALECGLYFQAVRLTDEDRARNASYCASARQAEMSKSLGNVEDYLAELSMQIDRGAVDAETSIRVTQLINKTNQFNLTTPRYSQEEVEARMKSPQYWCRWYRLKDRFADHGLIGVLIAQVAGRHWNVDAWLMSCRVIGRGVESFMFRDLVQFARESGADRITARYIPTSKNGLVAQLLPQFGFAETCETGDFVLDVASAKLSECTFLHEAKVA